MQINQSNQFITLPGSFIYKYKYIYNIYIYNINTFLFCIFGHPYRSTDMEFTLDWYGPTIPMNTKWCSGLF